MRLVTALLVRNEADRYLKRVLERCAEFSDAILVLDDGSTDGTPELAQECSLVLLKRRQSDDLAWGKETPARKELWERGAKLAGDGWLLICDADMILKGDPRSYTETWECNSWAWPLVDLWDSEQTFRVDGPWSVGPSTPRPWLFRPSAVPDGWSPQWGTAGLHSGHAPPNFPTACGVATELLWYHLAYVKPDHRILKHQAYMSQVGHLSEWQRSHAASILD
jgi:hypothetical protein